MMDCGVAIDGENGVAGLTHTHQLTEPVFSTRGGKASGSTHLLATDDVQPACMESDPLQKSQSVSMS